MKSPFVFLLSIPTAIFAQNTWSPTVQITPDSVEAINPAFGDSWSHAFNSEGEWLVFTQVVPGASDIIAFRTNADGANWLSTPYVITRDTIRDDNASLARLPSFGVDSRRMIVWERGRNDIYFSTADDSVWSPPAPLATGNLGGTNPCVAGGYGANFGAVWENGGRILFSEYTNGTWSAPIFITDEADTVNFHPQIRYEYNNRRIVVWERRKRGSRERAIAFSTSADTSWTLTDTLTGIGDNRNPRFLKMGWAGIMLSYESNRSGQYGIFGTSGDWNTSGFYWDSPSTISGNSLNQKNTDASFMAYPIITTRPANPTYFFFAAGTWRRSEMSGRDSIVVAVQSAHLSELRSAGDGENRNPVLSPGVFSSNIVRVWSVWQSNTGGKWKLYGSMASIIIDAVEETEAAKDFHLNQNFPNPFNPMSTISFDLLQPSFVTLKVFDLLGRELATFVNERRDIGHYEVVIAAGQFGSGVYFYRLTSGGYSQTRKMIILK